MERDFSNHLFVQDEREDKNFLQMNEEFYSAYFNTLNNEEKEWKNTEDKRTIIDEKYLKSNELSLNVLNDERLHVGGCKRQNYLNPFKSCFFFVRFYLQEGSRTTYSY